MVLSMKRRVHELAVRIALKRPLTGYRFGEHHADGKDVRTVIDLLAQKLLR